MLTVLLNDNHTPHAAMLIQSLPDVQFTSMCWNGALRSPPPNCQIVRPPECFDSEYDAALDDDFAMPAFQARARNKIFLQHNEWGGTTPIALALEKCTRLVVVSEHKRSTMREHGLSPKVVTIGFGFDPAQWQEPPCEREGAGTTFNGLADPGRKEVLDYTEALNALVPLTVIGHNNDGANVERVVQPYGFEKFKAELNRLAVFVYTVVGEQMGMATYEAMMMGIPVVTASQPEAWNFLFSDWNSMITRRPPIDSLEWIANTIKSLLADPGRAKAMGEAGRRTVTARFPLSGVGEQYRRLFEA